MRQRSRNKASRRRCLHGCGLHVDCYQRTPLNALLAWVKSSSSNRSNDKGDAIHDPEETLLHIEKLLQAHDNGVDARLVADA